LRLHLLFTCAPPPPLGRWISLRSQLAARRAHTHTLSECIQHSSALLSHRLQVECDYSQNRALLSAFQVTHGHFLQQNTRARFASQEFLLFGAAAQREKYKVSCRDADNAAARYITGSGHQESHVSARFIDFPEWWRIFYYLRLKKCSLAVGVMNESVAQQPDQQQSRKYEIGFAFMMCLIF
jgi:hypothetical protein